MWEFNLFKILRVYIMKRRVGCALYGLLRCWTVQTVTITACSVTNIDSESVCCVCVVAVKPFWLHFVTAVCRKKALEKIQQTKKKQKQSDGERNRDRVNQMWSERNQNPPTGKSAELLSSLYGQKLPQRPQDHLGAWVSMNHGAAGIVDQTAACMKAAVKNTNKLQQL